MQVVFCNAKFCLPELQVEELNYSLNIVRLRNVACVLDISFEIVLENVLDIGFSFLMFRCERHTCREESFSEEGVHRYRCHVFFVCSHICLRPAWLQVCRLRDVAL